MRDDLKTVIHQDGLRYESKVGGSPYLGESGTMSCILCGRHRPRSLLRPVVMAGARQYRCREECRNG
ncbi:MULTISPECIES: hypothetical protein [Ramlibacter]|uniref:Recombinase zinc beta ribbon domain-containing protein n=1 Tax=Ramlibacter aquaticus TaxID=2780094 RepID=A0ABR9SA54_9BURK|nr:MULTISPECIES: hypothetical protein [Ramlibacter]MBE7939231.1 hypothetical protein [Ramlibacter aquaticus]